MIPCTLCRVLGLMPYLGASQHQLRESHGIRAHVEAIRCVGGRDTMGLVKSSHSK